MGGVSVLLESALNSYFQEQQAFQAQMKAKGNGQLCAAFPGADDTGLAVVAQGQHRAAFAIQETMTLQMSHDRYAKLENLARAAQELQQALKDVRSLINQQGENAIGGHNEATPTETGEAWEWYARKKCRYG